MDYKQKNKGKNIIVINNSIFDVIHDKNITSQTIKPDIQ